LASFFPAIIPPAIGFVLPTEALEVKKVGRSAIGFVLDRRSGRDRDWVRFAKGHNQVVGFVLENLVQPKSICAKHYH
jgi:hypothetical protein